MDADERVVILTTPSNPDGVRLHIEHMIESKGKNINLLMKQVPTLSDAIDLLDQAVGDLVAVSPEQWDEVKEDRFTLVGILPRREPTWVLVSDNNPEHLIHQPKLVCDSELVMRQFLRLRKDVTFTSSSEILKGQDEYNSPKERWMSIEQMRLQGSIDGYIIPRSLYGLLHKRVRRHTLGIQRGQPKGVREHFIPPPLHGFSLLIGRVGFQSKMVDSLLHAPSLLAYQTEMLLKQNLPEELSTITGVFVEQRKLGALMKESKQNDEGFFERFYINSEKKPIRKGPQFEVILEAINEDATVSFGCYKVIEIDALRSGAINILKEFESIYKQLNTDFEPILRAPEGLPDEYKAGKKRLFKPHN